MVASPVQLSAGLLGGVVVLDFTHVLAGPFSAMVLGDLGADVIKVERLGGEETRRSDFRIGDYSEQFAIISRNKRSLTVDLSTERGRGLIRELIPKIDVVLENFRPGTMERLGLGYEQLSAINPRLVYCGISAFGATGSDSQRGAFDLVAQAVSGLMSVTGSRDGELVKIGIPISDITAGLYATILTAAALFRREQSGKGERIDVSLIHSAMSLLPWEAAEMWSKDRIPGPMGT
ncbi:MAG: CoA transferase, partial [Propionibacteriaceae bacterium]|nr:CoA transferase [Propionibacteriaceae bacterium]